MSNLFPMFLKLEGKRCLVVGAGKVGEPKIGGLIDTGARIRVIALQASETVRGWAEEGTISLELRPFAAEDLDETFLAVVATASRALNESIYREAQLRAVLCNVVDVPEYCDFYYPAVVAAAICRLRSPRTGKVPLCRKSSGNRLSDSLVRDMRNGWRSWVRPGDLCWPAIWILSVKASCCIRSQVVRR